MQEPPTAPTLYTLDLVTLGYAIGQLLRCTPIRAPKSLRAATIDFLNDCGINFTAMSDPDKEILFQNVGRGYASRKA